MKAIYNLLQLDSNSRSAVITVLSGMGMAVNLLIAIMKIVLGMAVSSMAIISEGVNNAADAGSSFLTLVGTKLAGMKPTKEYPFGFGRIEYLTSLIIGVIIMVAGGELFIDSIKLIITPEEVEISYLSMGMVAGSAVIKYLLARYQVAEGKRVNSNSLIAVGSEGMQDCIGSVITLTSCFTYMFIGWNLDAYASLITSGLVLKLSYEVLSETIGNILGQAGDKELADEIYRLIRKEPVILNAADMMLHNYGPDHYSGSVNIEVDHKKTMGEIYKDIHALQLRIMYEYNITMVFGMYAVDNDHPESMVMRTQIADFVRKQEHVISYHALYIDEKENTIFVDLCVDYQLRDWDKLDCDFRKYMTELYPNKKLELVIETEYV